MTELEAKQEAHSFEANLENLKERRKKQ